MMAVDRGPHSGDGQTVTARPLLLALCVIMVWGCGGSALDASSQDAEDDTQETVSAGDTLGADQLVDHQDVTTDDLDPGDEVADAVDAEDLDATAVEDAVGPSPDAGAAGSCAGQTDGFSCDDDNACTAESVCESGRCVSTRAVSCDDGQPCTDDRCDSSFGCVHTPNLARCDDGDACSTNDFCRGGVCIAGRAACDDGNPCTRNDCDTDGACDFVADDDLTCEDASACTGGDYCANGFCIGGTSDGCQAASTACVSAMCSADGISCDEIPLNGASCEDGNACTDADRCAAGACVSGSAIDCGWDAGCADFMCDPIDGCILRTLFVANTPCDDDDRCTLDTVCDAAGRCQGGADLVCDDRNGCTLDSCEPNRGCTTTSTTGELCDDANACTSTDTCLGSYCRGDAVNCDDEDPCTLDRCDSITGCVNSPVVCGSDNPCEVGSCDGAGGCVFAPRGGGCNDGRACTTNDRCLGGECVGTTSCDDMNLCTLDVCDQEEGCVFVPFEGPCDDGDPCTAGESCAAAGTCGEGQTLPVVDDGVPCTIDLCSADALGTHVSDPTRCGDGQGCSPTADCVDGATELVLGLLLLADGDADSDAFAVVVASLSDANFDLQGYTLRLKDGSNGVVRGLEVGGSVPLEPGARVALIHTDSVATDVYAALGPDVVIVGVFGTAGVGLRWTGTGDVLTLLSPAGRVLGATAEEIEN